MVLKMAKSLYEAQTLREFITLLKEESGLGYAALAKKIGLASGTLFNLSRGNKADDVTLDKIADYAEVSREWLYKLAKHLTIRPHHSARISALITLLERAPEDIQDAIFIQAKALIEARKKQSAQNRKDDV